MRAELEKARDAFIAVEQAQSEIADARRILAELQRSHALSREELEELRSEKEQDDAERLLDGDEAVPLSPKRDTKIAEVSVRARGVISGVGDGVFRGGACPTPECGVAGGHRVHRYGGVCTLQP
ncbi:hypothetical protein [Sphingopyxis macrogoltabida]|uniref:hypothetical protein n=1 Tax=Sphingopyxis macrogoltabida TaxID=33050 RepID=UPI0006ED1CDB|nr:hypothetical protein [Sphingopyxis macrogoltabida]ALJ12522.1 putative ATP-dependent DNA helicase PcrA [Sphingopyxis macrogoltabida]